MVRVTIKIRQEKKEAKGTRGNHKTSMHDWPSDVQDGWLRFVQG